MKNLWLKFMKDCWEQTWITRKQKKHFKEWSILSTLNYRDSFPAKFNSSKTIKVAILPFSFRIRAKKMRKRKELMKSKKKKGMSLPQKLTSSRKNKALYLLQGLAEYHTLNLLNQYKNLLFRPYHLSFSNVPVHATIPMNSDKSFTLIFKN